jgi:hypothetical protein
VQPPCRSTAAASWLRPTVGYCAKRALQSIARSVGPLADVTWMLRNALAGTAIEFTVFEHVSAKFEIVHETAESTPATRTEK